MQARIINALIYLKACFGIQMKAPILKRTVLCSINPLKVDRKLGQEPKMLRKLRARYNARKQISDLSLGLLVAQIGH